MGHDEEKWPEDRIVELTDELAQAQSRIAFFEHSQAPARPMIHAKLIEVMREVTHVAKSGMNTQQNYPFRGIDGVMNEVGPAMRKVGVLAIPTVLQYKNRDTTTTGDKKTREVVMEVRYDFYAEDGSSVSAIVWGESLDFSDKGTAKALSVALRQALLQTLMLPTQEPTTDDDGHYLTRGNTQTLSGWTASFGKKVLTDGTMDDVIGFWPAIVETGSIEAQHQAGSGWLTWGEMTAKRVAHLIDTEESPETLRAWYGQLKAADMIGLWHTDASGRSKLGDLVVERGKTVIGNRAKAFDHCMTLITSALDVEALEAAVEHVTADADNGPLTREQAAQLYVVAEERRNKLATVSGQAAPTDEPLPPVGKVWDEFVTASDAPNLTADHIRALLDGSWSDGDAGAVLAEDFGVTGLVRVADAIRRSNARDHTISDTDRANLLQQVTDRAHELNLKL